MTVVVGPCFSLAASGGLGKALLYYDTKWGARVKIPSRTFKSPCQAWEINKEWFKKANIRWKALTSFAKRAWNQWSTDTCDVGRDLFMGRQIELWNMSPLNNTTWPELSVPVLPSPPDLFWRHLRWWPVNVWNIGFQNITIQLWKEYWKYWSKSIVGVRWFQKLDSAAPPSESDLKVQNHATSHEFILEAGHVNYLWYQFIRWDGSYSNLTYCLYESWV